MNSLSPAKRELLEARLRQARQAASAARAIPRRERGVAAPLSESQQRLWLLDQLVPGLAAYNVCRTLRVSGPLDVAALHGALDIVVARHDVLRSVFVDKGGPVQEVRADARADVVVHDLRDRGTSAARELLAAAAARPFDLRADVLLRATICRVADDEWLVLIATHHIASDERSKAILFDELSAAYDALSHERPVELPDVAVQFGDFAAWQREAASSDALAPSLDWWSSVLAGAPGALELPSDRPRPAAPTFKGARLVTELDGDTAARLMQVARAERATPFMAYAALFALTLARWATTEDVVIGAPVTGRTRLELDRTIGYFSDMLPLRIDVSGQPTFRDLIGRARDAATGAFAHQDVPFARLVEHLRLARDLSINPVFQAGLSAETSAGSVPSLSGLEVEAVEVDPGHAKFDLTLVVRAGDVGAGLLWEYSTDLFDEATVADFAASFELAVRSAVADPDQPARSTPMLSAGALSKVLADGRGERRPEPAATIVEEILAHARTTPDAVAVTGPDATWTYAELVAHGSWVAARLREQGAGRGDLIGVCTQRSAAMVAALLGVLQIGAAYVPLDPHFPADRLAFMLDDSGAKVLLTWGLAAGEQPAFAGPVVRIDEPGTAAAPDSGDAELHDLAYVIYTSGSTGKPKGVMIEHLALANFIHSMAREPGLGADDVLVAVTTLSFDIAGLELWLPLTRGARVVVVSAGTSADPIALASVIDREQATVVQATPATWRMLLDSGWPGSSTLKVLCGGEALPTVLADELRSCVGQLWNMYGPTETTIWSTLHRVDQAGPVPLGHQIDETDLVVVDAALTPVPAGVAGELLIGGLGLARGYLGRPELTAERFVEIEIAGRTAHYYRTGDLVRRRRDGRLDYIARMDNQIKLRGFRIELGEIEAVLERHPLVREAAVLVRQSGAGDPQLVAYLSWTQEEASAAEVRQYAGDFLPSYMVPALVVSLEAFPRTPNGKLDRKALPEPADWTIASSRDYVAPRTPVEEQLAQIWGELLGLERVGVDDSFFDLGGHSLLVVSLASRLRDRLGIEIGLRAIYEAPSLGALGDVISGQLVADMALDLDAMEALLAEIEESADG